MMWRKSFIFSHLLFTIQEIPQQHLLQYCYSILGMCSYETVCPMGAYLWLFTPLLGFINISFLLLCVLTDSKLTFLDYEDNPFYQNFKESEP